MLKRFLVGNSISKVVLKANQVKQQNKIPVINFAVESTKLKNSVFREYESLHKKINNNSRIALKLSSFDFDKKIINDIIQMFCEKNIKILVDAEQNNLNKIYQETTNELIDKFNQKKVNIFKTYQMYRKDSLSNLDYDLNLFKNNYLGIKLVRGAYWNSEYKEDHLFVKKKDTDFSYNKAIVKIFNSKTKNNCILATHNNESINLGYLLNQEEEKFEFGHLLGMKENKYKNLLENNQKINVYLPYGPYNKMIPYLSRRLYENLDTIKYMVL